MLPPPRTPRLDWHGIGHYATGDAGTFRPPRSAASDAREPGRTGTGLALRWRRYHLRWRSPGIEETGAENRNRAAVRRLFRGLPQPQPDRAPAVGLDRAACVRLGAGL